MNWRRLLWIAVLLPALDLQAAVRRVPQQFPTIQAALLAAVQGDTVLLAPGTYNESGLVAIAGIRFAGAGSIVDGGAGATILTIVGDGARVSGIVFRNGVQQLTIVGNDALVTACRFENTVAAVTLVGARPALRFSRFNNVIGGAFATLSGDDAWVTSNRFNVGSGGIIVTGNRSVVVANSAFGLGLNGGFVCVGDDACVVACRINVCAGMAIQMNGNRAIVERNRMQALAGSSAIAVAGDDYRINSNAIVRGLSAAATILVNQASPSGGGQIVGNILRDMAGPAMALNVSGAVVGRNRIARSGGPLQATVQVNGDGNFIAENSILDVPNDGIRLNGNANTIRSCTVARSLRDGFDLEAGLDNRIERCRASLCGADGLDNGATNTTARLNTLLGNGQDVGNDGSFLLFELNTFQTGGPGSPQSGD
ncbi:MAG: right-handed parallel beta-helix repeat-containing protein [Planctomycetota bacterium]|nr:right-handed parallel beta-helix repeat-containing protein [Planctomycetota bacterium]